VPSSLCRIATLKRNQAFVCVVFNSLSHLSINWNLTGVGT